MNRKYNLKLDLQFRCNNSTMKFRQSDNKTSDFFIRITRSGELFDVNNAIAILAVIKPDNTSQAQFLEIKEGKVYADLNNNMKDQVGKYKAQALLIMEDERVSTDVIEYDVTEDNILNQLEATVSSTDEFTMLQEILSRLSNIEQQEEQRMINEAERILSEENRKIEEAKRVEAELIRQHEEADRAKYDATRESNENIRKQNESTRLANETNRIDEETKRVEEEANRVEAEQLRKDNYNFMTEDEERRRSEANAHKEAEKLRAQAETNRVNEEAKRRTTEQARILAENTRVSNENTRKANETTRQTNETQRIETETQRQNRYNSFIADAEANASNFENYTNSAKIKEEERKSNELNRKSQEDRRVSNEVERISNENTRKANEKAREKNETSRQNIFENKVNEVDKKIIEINTTKDNFVSSISTKVDNKISEIDNVKDNFVSSVNTKVDSKISELDTAKSDMTNTVSNKVNEVETRFNALTSSQQQDAEVIDARDGETSLKARLDRDVEKAKQVYVNVEGSHISTDSSVGYLKDVEILGNTIQSASNLADIRSVGDKVEGQELYEIPVLSCGKNLWNGTLKNADIGSDDGATRPVTGHAIPTDYVKCPGNTNIVISYTPVSSPRWFVVFEYDKDKKYLGHTETQKITTKPNTRYIKFKIENGANIDVKDLMIEVGTVATPYEPHQEDKLTILSPTPLEKVGDVRDRIIEKDGVLGVEKNIETVVLNGSESYSNTKTGENYIRTQTTLKESTLVGDIGIICDKLIYNKDLTYSASGEAISITSSGVLSVSISKGKLNSYDSDGIKDFITKNNLLLKFQTTQPQFIPLPHDQQVKLRTFANKTNISFGCEIEGTIKAQIPKSLGATVNTHTEQINNLNKELGRVKKLEESTVSTVITESDFTTIEATSNGYFEDVKLEGKTLVNLCTRLYDQKADTVIDNGSALNYTKHPFYAQCDFKLLQNLKQNTTYTVVLNVTNFVEGMSLQVNFYKYGEWTVCSSTEYVKNKGVHTILLTTNENIADHIRIGKMNDAVESLDEYITLSKDVIILEGDHTQNPPSGYIEGLKSVGQDVEEIVVLSSTFEQHKLEQGALNYQGNIASSNLALVTDFIPVHQNVIYKITDNLGLGYDRIAFYDRNKNFLYRTDSYYGSKASEIKTIANSYFMKVSIYRHTTLTVENLPYIEVSSRQDKKRLLYYNNETQTWEKPILREWDSIEKHANGKYYYHQRSGDVVLNGSEDWNQPAWSKSEDWLSRNPNGFVYEVVISTLGKTTNTPIMCDKFNSESIPNSAGLSIGYCALQEKYLSFATTAQSTIEQWKSELQANNVTVVYQLAKEKVYECTNIDLITYNGETNFVIKSGVLSPRTTLKVHNNISNVVSLLQKKVSLLESNVTSYMITQNRLMLASRYNADTVSFKVDVASFSDTFEYDNDLYELILNNILVGKNNYNREYIENLTRFYWMDFVISDEMYLTLFEIIEEQHNPKVLEETPLI